MKPLSDGKAINTNTKKNTNKYTKGILWSDLSLIENAKSPHGAIRYFLFSVESINLLLLSITLRNQCHTFNVSLQKVWEKIRSFVVKSSERRKLLCFALFLLYQRDAEVTKHFEDLKWPILLFLVNWRKNIFGCFCPVGERKGCWAILRWKHPAGWQQSSTLGTNNSAPENFPSSLNRQSSQMDFLCSSPSI